MDLNNTEEILGYIHNQGIYRGDDFIVVSIFICNYQVGDYVLVKEKDSSLRTTILTEDDLVCDSGFLKISILGLIFDKDGRNINPHRATETSSGAAREEVPRATAVVS